MSTHKHTHWAHHHTTAKTAKPAAGRRLCGPHSAPSNRKSGFREVCCCTTFSPFMRYNLSLSEMMSFPLAAPSSFHKPSIFIFFLMEEKQVWTRIRIQTRCLRWTRQFASIRFHALFCIHPRMPFVSSMLLFLAKNLTEKRESTFISTVFHASIEGEIWRRSSTSAVRFISKQIKVLRVSERQTEELFTRLHGSFFVRW